MHQNLKAPAFLVHFKSHLMFLCSGPPLTHLHNHRPRPVACIIEKDSVNSCRGEGIQDGITTQVFNLHLKEELYKKTKNKLFCFRRTQKVGKGSQSHFRFSHWAKSIHSLGQSLQFPHRLSEHRCRALLRGFCHQCRQRELLEAFYHLGLL